MALPKKSDRAPTPFGPYLLDAPIAEGGMARVYRARLRGALGFEKPLVVKQVRPELAREPRFVEMFASEAKALVRLVHPHIVPIYELGVVDGVYFIAMEHIDGATLEGLLSEGALEPGPAAHLGIQVAEALHHAHDRHSLVHRDVTPRNIMVDEGGHARLLDFGIATPAEGSDGEVFGTPGYLSPEQARGREVGPKSDVFSLGCVLARAMTNEAPYAGEVGKERLLAGDTPDLEGLPEALAQTVLGMLASDPEDRPTAAAVARQLRTWLAGAHPGGVAAETAERARRVKDTTPTVVTTGESTAAVGKVQTLATSAILEDVRPSEPIPAEPEEATAQIAGRRGRDDDPEESESESASESESESEPEPESESESESGSPARWVIGALAVAGLVLAVVFGLRAPEPADVDPSTEANDPERVTAPPDPEVPEPETAMAETMETAPVEPTMEAVSMEAETMAALPAARASLRISASPWAEVRLGRRDLGTTPVRRVSVPVGTHRVHFSCPPLGVEVDHTISLEPGDDLALFADLEASPARVSVR